jgi:hypothetical protein
MKTLPGRDVEMSGRMPGIVADHLRTVEWGTETYPLDSLELHDNEALIFQQVNDGMSLKDVSRGYGLPYTVAVARYHTAKGKHEAKNGLSADVTELSLLAQRVVILNSLFGATWNRGNSVVINTEPEVVLSNANKLDSILGYKWRRCPQLSVMGINTLKERIERYDAKLSPNWRNSPVLLTQSPDVVEERAAIYDGWFGEAWQMKPSILTNDPRTVISSARALKTVGITQENTPPGSYFALLGTTVANKRKKAAFIRRELLGHKQVHIHESKKPISEIVSARQSQSPKDRELESNEIAELKTFLRHLGAKGLTQSVEVIRKWSYSHGYPIASNAGKRASAKC